jgi:hypothetical protein
MNTSCWFHSLQLIYALVHLTSWTNLVTVTMTMSERKTLRSCESLGNLAKTLQSH